MLDLSSFTHAEGKGVDKNEIRNSTGSDTGRVIVEAPTRQFYCFGRIGRGCIMPPPAPMANCGANQRCRRSPPVK